VPLRVKPGKAQIEQTFSAFLESGRPIRAAPRDSLLAHVLAVAPGQLFFGIHVSCRGLTCDRGSSCEHSPRHGRTFSVKGSTELARTIWLSRVIVGHQPANEHLRLDRQGVSPSQVAVRGNTTVPVFELRNECVVFGSHFLRQFALRQTALFPQLAQPASRLLA